MLCFIHHAKNPLQTQYNARTKRKADSTHNLGISPSSAVPDLYTGSHYTPYSAN